MNHRYHDNEVRELNLHFINKEKIYELMVK